MALHAFWEQLRFVKGGRAELPRVFWRDNGESIERVKAALMHLVHGPGDLVGRLHDVLYDRDLKVAHFGTFCALELLGSLRPDECPPINGRMAKALRIIGFQVRGD